MNSLLLKEVGASNPDDQTVLELFASFREHVIHVSATHLLPCQIAVTTKNGFIELIQTATGEFRLFLTYLDRIPLDASLRCFSLVPSLYAASTRRQHCLVYSLAYSNELLLANVETGTVQTLAACVSRPSVVECDSDYIVCGEGNGQVSVWRGSAEPRDRVLVKSSSGSVFLPPLMWQQKFFDDTVVCISLHRDQLVCCGADFACFVASIEDGTVRASLSPLELERGVAAFALTQPPLGLGEKAMALCLTSRIAVFAASAVERTEGAAKAAAGPSTLLLSASSPAFAERWSYRGGCALNEGEEITCASCLGAYMAAGTQSGLVVLYTCDAVRQQVTEVVRFNVGYGVRGTQLFADATLLVVTSVGDVWRWPLKDLLHTAVEGGVHSAKVVNGGDGEETTSEQANVMKEEEEPIPETGSLPQPVAAPGSKTTAHLAQLNATPHEVSYMQKGEGEKCNLLMQNAPAVTDNDAYGEERTAQDTTAAVSVMTTAVPFPEPGDAEGDSITSVHLSSLHRGEDTELIVSTDDEDGGDSQREEEDEDSLGTVGQPTEPVTALSLDGPPPQPSIKRQSPGPRNGEEVRELAAEKRPRAALYDPEVAGSGLQEENRGAVDASEMAGAESTELSQCDSTGGVSPPSSADTTAHIEVFAADVNERRSTSAKRSPFDKRDELGENSMREERDTVLNNMRPSVEKFPTNAEITKGGPKRGTSATGLTLVSSQSDERAKTTKNKEEMAQLEAEFDRAVARMLGPKASIEGLRRGRRMDPRKVAGVLHNLTSQHAASSAAVTNGDCSTDSTPPALSGLNSTKLLEEKRVAISAAVFDFNTYRQAHQLEVNALQYRHPVKALTYAPQDRVFDSVTEAVGRICGTENNGEGSVADTKKTAAVSGISPWEDELRDVTYGRVRRVVDPAIVEERRHGGPELLQHGCDDLLFPSPSAESTVLFQEDALLPSVAWEEVLLLPMPLPPASSVF